MWSYLINYHLLQSWRRQTLAFATVSHVFLFALFETERYNFERDMRNLLFNVTLAFRALRNNRMRSGITIAVIGLGITALVGILTSIEVMKVVIGSTFSSMGVNSFQITSEILKKKKHGGISSVDAKSITYAEAKMFKERYPFPAIVGVSMTASEIATLHFGSEKTNPNISITGVDDAYLTVNDTKLGDGRNFSATEVQSGSYVCILGDGTARKLFKKNINKAVNQVVTVGSIKCRVIGVMASKGSSMFMNNDNTVLLPLNTARQVYGGENSYRITVLVRDVTMKTFASEEAEGIFRVVRRLPLKADNNFSVSQNNDLVNMVLDNTKYVQISAIVICIITLLNSVIGLMNIMLESVSERTREIGVSKALGAKNAYIRNQFLTEAVMISLMGGAVGVVAGMLLGNAIGLFFSVGFIVPWLWISLGVGLCAFVGVISGIYPAIKASKLNPINALRYE
ncbi:MAG: ABC transporter permease [Taibaiella sp.]|nr:ABC transporter permease [Taibaiella sp.]